MFSLMSCDFVSQTAPYIPFQKLLQVAKKCILLLPQFEGHNFGVTQRLTAQWEQVTRIQDFLLNSGKSGNITRLRHIIIILHLCGHQSLGKGTMWTDEKAIPMC